MNTSNSSNESELTTPQSKLRRVRKAAPAFRSLEDAPVNLNRNLKDQKSKAQAPTNSKVQASTNQDLTPVASSKDLLKAQRKRKRDCFRCAECSGNCPI